MGCVVNATTRLLYPGKDPVPFVQEAGWDPGPVWTGAENLSSTGIRSPDRPARSESLYWLSYHGTHTLCGQNAKICCCNRWPMYCLLLMRLQLAGTAWVEIPNISDDGRGEKHTDPVKNMSLYHYMTFFRMVACVSFITGLKSNLCDNRTTENTTESNFIVSHARKTTVLQSNIILNWIHRWLVRNKSLSAFPSAHNYQGQLLTPRSVTLFTTIL
jgi:hypothetical protein